ncbi:uncharacterized protein LOC143029868 [Oratosquilla oratoria]|uniref:uncharacterized protein LOC143029868 n=1 Tax=Oratosquilla oratoria TaxID=337810 RepID=UPI003F763614
MGGCRGGGLDHPGYQGRLSSSFSHHPQPLPLSHPSQQLPSGLGSRAGPSGGNLHSAPERSTRGSLNSGPGVLLEAIPSTKGYRGVETCHRSVSSQQVPFPDEVPDGHPRGREGVYQGRGLHGVPGPPGRLFPNTCPSLIPKIPPLRPQGDHFSIHLPMLRPLHSTPSLHQSVQTRLSVVPLQRDSPTPLPGRLADPGTLRPAMPRPPGDSPSFHPQIGLHGQPDEVRFHSKTESHVPGYGSGLFPHAGIPSREANPESLFPRRAGTIDRVPHGQTVPSPPGPHGLRREVNTQEQTENATPTVAPQVPVVPAKGRHPSTHHPYRRGQAFSSLVEGPMQPARGDAPRPISPRSPPLLRCLQGGLGGPPQRRSRQRFLVHGRADSPYQLARIESGTAGSPSLLGSNLGESCGHHVGQFLGSSLPEQAGGHSLPGPLPSHYGDPPISREPPSDTQSSLHPREKECLGGPPQQKESGNQHGVVPPSGSGDLPHQQMGLPSGGPFRHQMEPPAPGVFQPSPGSAGSGRGCSSAKLGQPRHLRFPTVSLAPKGAPESTNRIQPSDDFDRSLVAGSPMVSRRPRASSGGAPGPSGKTRPSTSTSQRGLAQEPVSPGTSRVQTMVRILLEKGFPKEVAEDMSSPIRSSSAALYQGKWNAFAEWCHSRAIAPEQATIPLIASFFHFLRKSKKISLSAVQGYRAALNQVFSLKGMDLALSPEISMLFRHFRKSCPPREITSPPWDVALVLNALRGPPYEPLRDANFKDLTLKTVFLLALASSKRVGELHAISYRVAHSKGWQEVSFTFLPQFVAKNQDPAKADPRFWSFSIPSLDDFVGGEHAEMVLCPVRAIRTYLKRTKHLRPDLPRLFVSTRGTPKPVTKTSISYWIKEVIRRAYASSPTDYPGAKAHDLRAIGPSLVFRKNRSVNQVLQAGIWKSQTTFTSFYLKDVMWESLGTFSLGPIVAAQEVLR